MNQRLAFQKARVDALQKAIDARQDLLKVLTPEQVKVFDSVESRTHARNQRYGFVPGHRGPHHSGYAGMPSAPHLLVSYLFSLVSNSIRLSN